MIQIDYHYEVKAGAGNTGYGFYIKDATTGLSVCTAGLYAGGSNVVQTVYWPNLLAPDVDEMDMHLIVVNGRTEGSTIVRSNVVTVPDRSRFVVYCSNRGTGSGGQAFTYEILRDQMPSTTDEMVWSLQEGMAIGLGVVGALVLVYLIRRALTMPVRAGGD